MHQHSVDHCFDLFVPAKPPEKCIKLTLPHITMCCKTLPETRESDMEMVKECIGSGPKPHGPPSCDADLCIAKKRGVASEDGTIDIKALEADIEREFENFPETLEAVKEKCINGDTSNYGPPDMCELAKIRHCLQSQIVMNCKDFDSNKPHCSGIKDLIEECKNQF